MPVPSEITISPAANGAAMPKIGSSLLVSGGLHATVIVAFLGASWLVRPDSVTVQLNAGDASRAADATVQLTASVSVDPLELTVQTQPLGAEVSLSSPESFQSDAMELDRASIVDREPAPVDRGEAPRIRPRRRDLRASSSVTPRVFADSTVSAASAGTLSGLTKVVFETENPRLDPTRVPPKPPAKRSELKPLPENELTQPAASAASVAAEKLGAKIDDVPHPLASNVPPAFPAAALAQGRSGRVVLKVVVDSAGQAKVVSVHRSSGHADLDAAACSAVSAWRFTPAQQPSGSRPSTPALQAIAVPVVFEFADE